MASFTQRMIGAARLDPAVYEEVEADKGAMGQALGVVLLSAGSAGLAATADGGLRALFGVTIAALFGWFIWAFLAWLIGTKLLPEPQTQSDLGELLRTIGFAASPGVLQVLGSVPLFGALIQFIVVVWMLVAMVVAVRQALDYRGTGRAIVVCAIGFLAYCGSLVIALFVLGISAKVFGLIG
ncbi:MAG: YIP1 family protein [Candidatus Eiseniibacteriota bacterium]